MLRQAHRLSQILAADIEAQPNAMVDIADTTTLVLTVDVNWQKEDKLPEVAGTGKEISACIEQISAAHVHKAKRLMTHARQGLYEQ